MGKVTIRLRTDLDTVLFKLKDAEEWNEVIKYSPCGNYMAVGSHDNKIYIYDVKKGYTLYYTCNKHNSFVTSLDWT
jgi:WD40 repeat protein